VKLSMATTILAEEPLLSGLYTLYYRGGVNASNSMQTKNFRFHGKLADAIVRGQKHCDLMGMRFSFVQPFVSNLDKEEAYHLGIKPQEKELA
jgi:hypothetical protein